VPSKEHSDTDLISKSYSNIKMGNSQWDYCEGENSAFFRDEAISRSSVHCQSYPPCYSFELMKEEQE
jgi:hypothetical protein